MDLQRLETPPLSHHIHHHPCHMHFVCGPGCRVMALRRCKQLLFLWWKGNIFEDFTSLNDTDTKNQRKIIQCLLGRISGMYVTHSSTDTCQIQQRLPTHSIDVIEKTGRALTDVFWTGSMQNEKACRKDSELRRACWHSARLGCTSFGLSSKKTNLPSVTVNLRSLWL